METSQGIKGAIKKAVGIDKIVFFGAIIALLAVALPIIIFPESSAGIINSINSMILTKFGVLFIWFGLFCLVFCFWISFSRYGKIVLGDEGEKPEFSNFSWASMLFCAGVGAGVVYWGIIEWVYYYKAPPLGVEKVPGRQQKWQQLMDYSIGDLWLGLSMQ